MPSLGKGSSRSLARADTEANQEYRQRQMASRQVRDNFKLAVEYAENPELQETNPLYCAELFNALAAPRSRQEQRSSYIRSAAYFFALANRSRRVTACAYQFVCTFPESAIFDARNPVCQRNNPLYCAEIFNLLSDYFPEKASYPGEWMRCAAYFFALTSEDERLKVCVTKFIQANRAGAAFDAKNISTQRGSPRYWQRLCESLQAPPHLRRPFFQAPPQGADVVRLTQREGAPVPKYR